MRGDCFLVCRKWSTIKILFSISKHQLVADIPRICANPDIHLHLPSGAGHQYKYRHTVPLRDGVFPLVDLIGISIRRYPYGCSVTNEVPVLLFNCQDSYHSFRNFISCSLHILFYHIENNLSVPGFDQRKTAIFVIYKLLREHQRLHV